MICGGPFLDERYVDGGGSDGSREGAQGEGGAQHTLYLGELSESTMFHGCECECQLIVVRYIHTYGSAVIEEKR